MVRVSNNRKERMRLYYQQHKAERREYKRQYLLLNRAKVQAQQSSWYQRNKPWVRERRRLYARQHTLRTTDRCWYGLFKRPRPRCCEVCNQERKRLSYHHWDDDHPDIGLWLCGWCHAMAEVVDKGYHDIYLRLKGELNNGRIA
ncbi:hypothetical protein ES708_28544 [subsurface metagenome]